MRQITRGTLDHPDRTETRDGGTGFIVGAVVCAAVVATLFALHGGPDLLAGKLPTATNLGASTQ